MPALTRWTTCKAGTPFTTTTNGYKRAATRVHFSVHTVLVPTGNQFVCLYDKRLKPLVGKIYIFFIHRSIAHFELDWSGTNKHYLCYSLLLKWQPNGKPSLLLQLCLFSQRFDLRHFFLSEYNEPKLVWQMWCRLLLDDHKWQIRKRRGLI